MNISRANTVAQFELSNTLPDQCNQGSWVGRVWVPAKYAANNIAGPRVVSISKGQIFDLSEHYLTMSDLFADPDKINTIKHQQGKVLGSLDQILSNSLFTCQAERFEENNQIVLLAPNDIQAAK